MPWLTLEGHDDVVEKFRSALAKGRLGSTFLFVGPEGVGKRAFATRLAQSLLCETRDAAELDPCGQCPGCQQTLAGTHPDFLYVCRPAGKNVLPLGLLKGDDPDYPVRESLLFNLSLRPFRGGRKVAVIDDADYLNQEGANCLLKTLEEPPAGSVLILIGTSADRQLPTIRSRAQIVRFKPLAQETLARLLVEQGVAADPATAKKLAQHSGGSLSRARELADPELWKFRTHLFDRLAQSVLPSVSLSQDVSKFVDEAGKEAPLRRARLRIVLGFVVDFYRHLVHRLSGHSTDGDETAPIIERAAGLGVWDVDNAAEAVSRTLDALQQIDRNANQSTLIEAWLDDLLSISRHQMA